MVNIFEILKIPSRILCPLTFIMQSKGSVVLWGNPKMSGLWYPNSVVGFLGHCKQKPHFQSDNMWDLTASRGQLYIGEQKDKMQMIEGLSTEKVQCSEENKWSRYPTGTVGHFCMDLATLKTFSWTKANQMYAYYFD